MKHTTYNSNPNRTQLLINGRGTMPSNPKRPILPTDATGEATLEQSYSEEEYMKGITSLKNGKAAAIDDVLVEPR